MRARAATVVSLALLAASVGALLPGPAAAQTEPETVTLEASATRITFGDEVTLSGAVSPASGGQAVQVLDEHDAVVATATTGSAGRFSVRIAPEGSRTYRAVWNAAASEPETVNVRAVVSVRMSVVRLFDDVVVRGTVRPARPGARVEVSLLRAGRLVERATPLLGAAGGFRATFRAMAPGTHRARAVFSAPDLLRGAAVSGAGAPPLPALRSGSRGRFVELLEGRLVELDYRLAGARDGVYDRRTGDAVVAFHKVQGMARVFSVSAATWRALADPFVPRPRLDRRGVHFEVDQTRQVLYTVEGGEITNILHVSTGAGGATRDGTFRVHRKLEGHSPNRLYYPSYFDGLRAFHGWTEVPTYAASHGCVRLPYWNAIWVYRRAPLGTLVLIHH